MTNVNIIGLTDFDETLVGEVNETKDVITVPFNQLFSAQGYAVLFVGTKIVGSKISYTTSGNLILKKTETGWVQSTDLDDDQTKWGFGALAIDPESGSVLGWMDYIMPGVVLTAK